MKRFIAGEATEKLSNQNVAVVLMTYGSPERMSDLPSYLKNVRGGREPDKEIIAEFTRRYTLIGGSPLLRITKAQAAALERELNAVERGGRFRVRVGMRFAPPFIRDVVPQVSENAAALVGIIMSPQYSPIIMGGYVDAISRAVSSTGRHDIALRVAKEWHLQPDFVKALAEMVREGLLVFDEDERENVHVLMTAHSMPRRVVEKEPSYIKQLRETAAAVAESAGMPEDRWSFCYQSAGHSPEEWLKPDFSDVMPALRERGIRCVLVSPIQFLADHLETLYDIDIAARKQAEDQGMKFARAPALNDSPTFITALASVVSRTLTEAPLATA